jgi:DNA-binding MarR family transcriptional regulator
MPKSASKETKVNDLLRLLKESSKHTIIFHQSIAERLGLNITDHKCLDFISEYGPVTAGHLAEFTGLTTGAITAVIDRLEHGGYVLRERDATDRRRVLIRSRPVANGSENDSFNELTRATKKLCMSLDTRELETVRGFVDGMNTIISSLVRASQKGHT